MGKIKDCAIKARRPGNVARDAAERRLMAQFRRLAKGFGTVEEWEAQIPIEGELRGVMDAETKATDRRLANAKRDAVRLFKAIRDLETHEAAKGWLGRAVGLGHDQAEALRAKLSRDPSGRATFRNVADAHAGYAKTLYGMWGEGFYAMRTKWAGLWYDAKFRDDTVRALYGEKVADTRAVEGAKGYAKAKEFARGLYDDLGGDIALRKDYHLPNPGHLAERIRHAADHLVASGEKLEPSGLSGRFTAEDHRMAWVRFTEARIDPFRMFTDGGLPLGYKKQHLRNVLRGIYDTLVGREMEPASEEAMMAVANRRLDHRSLQFLDADSWLAYEKAFGSGDIFGLMHHDLDRLARDIAMMEVFGPNPAANFKALTSKVARNNAPKAALRRINNEWAVVTGTVDESVGITPLDVEEELPGVAGWIQKRWHRTSLAGGASGLRHLLVASQLGRAVISSISDLNAIRVTAQFNGLPVMRAYRELVGQLTRQDRRVLGVMLGLGNDNIMSRSLAVQRFAEDVTKSGALSKMSEFVIRSTGLGAYTQAQRTAIGMDFQQGFASQTARALGELSARMRAALERYGITAEDWDIIRSSPMLERDGVRFIYAGGILENVELDVGKAHLVEASQKWQDMLTRETELATPVFDVRARAGMLQGTQKGTPTGELLRLFGMYKMFPLMLAEQHFGRAMSLPGPWSKGRYLANLIIGHTLLGALAIQAKDLVKGNDPRPSDTWKFWVSAFVQGGGAGIFGDFLFSDVNRYEGGISQTFFGPSVKWADDTWKLTQGNLAQLLAGEDVHFGAEAARYLERYTPGSSTWYAGTQMQRLIFDQLALQSDPRAYRLFRENENRRRRQYGQSSWWPKGSPLPERAPDLTNVAP